MARNNRKCYTCGKEYYYCPSCSPKEPSYKSMHCSKVCRDIWNILAKNGTGKITAQEALEMLFQYELPLELNENVQRHIDRIVDEATTSNNAEDADEIDIEEEIKKEIEDE